MKRARIEIYRALRKMGVKREEITTDTNLTTDLCFDDTDKLCFIFLVESRLNIELTNEEIKSIKTVDDIINFTSNELHKQVYDYSMV